MRRLLSLVVIGAPHDNRGGIVYRPLMTSAESSGLGTTILPIPILSYLDTLLTVSEQMGGQALSKCSTASTTYMTPTCTNAPSVTAGCSSSYSGTFQIDIVPARSSAKVKRQANDPIVLTLSNGILTDNKGRTDYIAADSQFQFDKPPPANATYIAGWSVCGNGTLAINDDSVFYQCLGASGFYNIYKDKKSNASNCSYVYIDVINSSGGATASQISDGQVIATAASHTTASVLTTITKSPGMNSAPFFAAAAQTTESFDDIYLDLSKHPGKCRLAESGLGWKPAGGQTFTLDKADMINGQWSRAARGYELKVLARNAGVVQLDGFRQDDFDTIQKCFKVWYGVELLQREHALQGWNWGKSEMGRNEFAFSVRNKPAFEIPYTEISNTNLAGKNEVAVEFSLPADGEETGTNGHLGGARSKGRKMGGAVDQLTEMRFYIPGTETWKRKKKGQDEDGEEVEEGEEEEHNAATVFYETLMDKAEIGEVAGDTFATFLDILHLTPRGRFDIDLYEKSFRLRGKTYDYKVAYENAKRFFVLPKPDDMHTLLCIGLDPPLRQGQTRYPFIVMQFKREEEVNIELNMTEDDLNSKYNGKLQARYEAPIGNVIAKIFHGLTGKKLFQPSPQFVSHHAQSGVKCSIKANEGHLYCLDRAFLFVPKPATYISFENTQIVTMSRVGGAVSASRTFDITVQLKKGAGEHQFSNINREEQGPLESFFKAKGIQCRNEMDLDGGMNLAALNNDPDLASSDEEVVEARGSADEDDESVDEDFQADDESDVAEEFDSDAASSGGGDSDAEMEDADGGAGSDEDTAAKVERPKKKAKTGK